MVSHPALAITFVGLGIDDVEIDAGLDPQIGLFQTVFDDRRAADQDRAGETLFDHHLCGTQHALILALGENDALALGLAGGLEDGAHADTSVIHKFRQLGAVGVPVGDRTGRDTGVHRRLRHGRRNLDDQTRVERLGDQVIRAKIQVMARVSHGHFIGHFRFGQFGNGTNGGHLHLFSDTRRADIEGAAEDEGEAEHVVDLVHIVGTAGGDDRVRADLLDQLRHDFGRRIGEREDHRLLGHGLDHLLLDDTRRGQTEEDIGPHHGVT